MKWKDYVRASENILGSPHVPSSLEIITLIKKVNPTRCTLSGPDRERGYQLKNRLQSLLLEHYGDSFHLIPHPARPNINLIKHRNLPSIDACHTDAAALSTEAIEKVETAAPQHPAREEVKRGREKERRETGAALSPKEVLKRAQALLEEYDYAQAEEILTPLRGRGSGDLPVLARAADILLHEIGAYQRCVDFLLAQPKNLLKDRGIRETLAVAYHHNGSFPEARAILDELHPVELGLEALFTYADIAFKDGDLRAALELVKIAKGKEGFFSGLESLQKEIEAVMSARAEPLLQKARAAFQSGGIEDAGRWAREAIELYPDCQKARGILSAIEAMNEEAQLAELWARLENESTGERRIALLTILLERDKVRRDTIKELIAREKVLQRGMLFDEQLESLRALVLEECWPECFDGLSFLMRQPEFRERAREVLSLSPFFPVLYENKRLRSTAERNGKELWLRFVQAKIAFVAGEGCFETFEELKPWFNSCPEFKEDYLVLLQRERVKARKDIRALLERSEAARCPVGEVRSIHGRLRRRMQVLPVEERRELLRTMEEHLAGLVPEQNSAQPLEEYREALQIGNSEKAAYLRQEITDSAALHSIDAEFAEAFHIALEPLTLEVSDDLPIDLTTQPPLLILFFDEHRLFLKDGDESYVMIDFAAKAACRMTSRVFAKTIPFDSTRDGTFLFVEEQGEDKFGDKVWRAELSVERTAFTANFDMREWFDVEDGISVQSIMLSSERDTDYYVMIGQDEGRGPAKVLRKRLAPKATIQSMQMGNRTELKIWRLTSSPDRFIVGGEEEMRHVNRNLSLKATLLHTPDIYKLDRQNGCVYGLENYRLTQRGQKLELISSYETAYSLGIFEPGRVHGISIQTDTALIVLGDGRQAFYNLRDNKFSNKIRVGRVIPSEMDGKWYCFDYSREEGRLRLRDITRDIHAIMEWREFFLPWEKRKKREKLLLWFNQHDNFVYRPEEWGPCESETT